MIRPRHQFTVREYNRMAETGVFSPEARVELIQGEIITMSPIGHKHAFCVATLTELLMKLLGDRAMIWTQNPIELDDLSEPQPDVAVLVRNAERYAHAKPKSEDVKLIVEVSESTLDYDQDVKLPLYAESAIPEYWIVNLVNSTVEIYSQPHQGTYKKNTVAKRGEKVIAHTIDNLSIDCNSILG
jgi:Uma2 family endonuclease